MRLVGAIFSTVTPTNMRTSVRPRPIAENREDGELAFAAHVVAMREGELQAERVMNATDTMNEIEVLTR